MRDYQKSLSGVALDAALVVDCLSRKEDTSIEPVQTCYNRLVARYGLDSLENFRKYVCEGPLFFAEILTSIYNEKQTELGNEPSHELIVRFVDNCYQELMLEVENLRMVSQERQGDLERLRRFLLILHRHLLTQDYEEHQHRHLQDHPYRKNMHPDSIPA